MKDTLGDEANKQADKQQKNVHTKQATMPGRDEQKKFALDYIDKPLKLGDKWYLIGSDWYSKWAAYVGIELSSHNNNCTKAQTTSSSYVPSQINNKKLLEYNDETKKYHLKDGLIEEIDFYTIPQELWDYLVKIYSINAPEEIIEREVINDSVDEDARESLKIEIHKMNVKMECNWNNKSEVKTEQMSRQTKLESLIELMKKSFQVPGDKEVRLYFKPLDESMMTQVEVKQNSTLNTASYSSADTILMCVQEDNGSWPVVNEAVSSNSCSASVGVPPCTAPPITGLASPITAPPSYSSTRNSNRNYDSFSSTRGNEHRAGLCGLSNLGNTCFMNSALQCMSNVPLLTDYFKQGRYKKEINTVNPLGRQGEIAEAYAHLIHEMWSGANSYTMPRAFKLSISKFAPQFTGYQQQDSQELLAFLLDGLHEDLNRILKKPYVELGSHVGKTDEVFAEESWQDHKKRNDSIIVDIFHGLLKSTLNCLDCAEISIKFDPFCYLSVPLPSKKERLIELIFVPSDQTQQLMKFKVPVLKNGTIQDLCGSLEALIEKDTSIANKVSKNRMVVCDVYSYKFFKIYESSELVSSIRERDDIYVYELATNFNNNEYLKVKLHLREKSQYMTSSNCFGLPIMFMVAKENLTYGAIYDCCLKYLKRYLKSSSSMSEENSINSKLNNSLNVNDEDIYRTASNDVDLDNNVDNDNATENNFDVVDDNDDVVSDNSQSVGVRSSDRLKKKANKKNRIFQVVLSKSDNIDFENFSSVSGSQSASSINDDTPFDWQMSSNQTNSREYLSSSQSNNVTSGTNQIVSLIADFTNESVKKFYKKKVTEDILEHSSCSSQLIKRKDVISLAECFNLYTKVEELSEQDYWYCSKCKTHKPSTKKFDLWKLPQVLVVHLKRFSYSRLYRDKIDTLVEFPLTDLDMEPYLISKNNIETKYNLIAVSNHYGSLGGGHYTAFGQNRVDGRWYYFDDSSVTNSDESSVCTSAAYLLVYLRKDLHKQYVGVTPSYNLDLAAKDLDKNLIDSSNQSNSNNSSEKMDY